MYRFEKIDLEGVSNTRDLGGIPTLDQRVIKEHLLIRSGALAGTTEEDRRKLVEEYDLRTVIDFRTEAERMENPDPVIDGVTYLWNPILGEQTVGITREKEGKGEQIDHMIGQIVESGVSGEQYMSNLYSHMAAKEEVRKNYARFFELLLQNEKGAVLWHCTAGKDRVGVGTALLLSALGVERELIFEDYLMTNTFQKEEVDQILERVSDTFSQKDAGEGIRQMLSVKRSYLEAVFTQIDENFGGIDQYLKQEIGLTEERREALKEKYLKSL